MSFVSISQTRSRPSFFCQTTDCCTIYSLTSSSHIYTLLIIIFHRYVIDINARYSYIHMNLWVEKYYVCDITRYLYYFRSFKLSNFFCYICVYTIYGCLRTHIYTYMFTSYSLNVFCAINIFFLLTFELKEKTLVLSMFHLECCLNNNYNIENIYGHIILLTNYLYN